MSTINESISRVREILLDPMEQAPSVRQVFGGLLREFQNFHNELTNSHEAWTTNTETVTLSSSTSDYLVNNSNAGKILFVTATPEDPNLYPVNLEFADLRDLSGDFWLYSPLDYGYSRDFNEAGFWAGFPSEIAFYRKDGDLYFRLMPLNYSATRITITYSTGNWADNVSTESGAVLTEHHGLVEVRTALNLLPACEWTGSESDEIRRRNLVASLSAQESRYAQTFMYAKRSMTADHVTERVGFGDYY